MDNQHPLDNKLRYHWVRMLGDCGKMNDIYDTPEPLTMDKSWEDFDNFKKWSMENGFGVKKTLGFLDISKGYFPDNCKWIYTFESWDHNNKDGFLNSATKYSATIDGETKSVKEWSKIFDISYTAVLRRIHKGMDSVEALNEVKAHSVRTN